MTSSPPARSDDHVPQPSESPGIAGRPHLVLPRRTDPAGIHGPTPGQARGPGFRRTSHGFHVRSSVPRTAEQRIAEASVLVLPGRAITGWAALAWLGGGRWFDGDGRPITIACGTLDLRPQPRFGIDVTGEGLGPARVLELDGVRVTDAAWSVSFEMRHARDWRAATVVLDMAAACDLVSTAEVAATLAGQNGWNGVPQARRALAVASENSWSPRESLMRLVWTVDAGLPPPSCNTPVFDLTGRHLATPDLLDLETGMMGEYDGAGHLERAQRFADLRRADLLEQHDLTAVVMVAEDLLDVRDYLERLRRSRARAAARGDRDRSWTVTPPPWWVSTHTVARRRGLDAEQRARWLRHRDSG